MGVVAASVGRSFRPCVISAQFQYGMKCQDSFFFECCLLHIWLGAVRFKYLSCIIKK